MGKVMNLHYSMKDQEDWSDEDWKMYYKDENDYTGYTRIKTEAAKELAELADEINSSYSTAITEEQAGEVKALWAKNGFNLRDRQAWILNQPSGFDKDEMYFCYLTLKNLFGDDAGEKLSGIYAEEQAMVREWKVAARRGVSNGRDIY